MADFKRYAIYYVPHSGGLAEFGAKWLGWDMNRAKRIPPPNLPGFTARMIDDMTSDPRRYGFHGTLKAPFYLDNSKDVTKLTADLAGWSAQQKPISMPGLRLNRIGGFLALTPMGDVTKLEHLASDCVQRFDTFRAPIGADELSKRRAKGLSPRQDHLLQEWGYPYVLDEFRFHMTLTRPLDPSRAQEVRYILTPLIDDYLPRPFVIDHVALVGEAKNGRFRVMSRHPLGSGA